MEQGSIFDSMTNEHFTNEHFRPEGWGELRRSRPRGLERIGNILRRMIREGWFNMSPEADAVTDEEQDAGELVGAAQDAGPTRREG